MGKTLFLVWHRYDRRAELFYQQLGGVLHWVHCGRRGQLALAPLRYVCEAAKSWRILMRERPTVVFTVAPPVFSAMVAWAYCLLFGGAFTIDTHSSTFLSAWRTVLPLHRWLSRRALTTITHNRSLDRAIEGWGGCRHTLIGYVPGNFVEGAPFALSDRFNVVFPCSFDDDEPIAEVFEAVRGLPDFEVYVTGNSNNAAPGLVAQMPANCHLTGYLPEDQYVGLLRGADVVLDLTKWNDTVLLGGFEAVALGTPLVVSGSEVLRECFAGGAVFCENTAEGIREGLQTAQRQHSQLREDVAALAGRLESDWQDGIATLRGLIEQANGEAASAG